MKPDKRHTAPLVQLLATGWSHAHGGKHLNLVPWRWRMTVQGRPIRRIGPAWTDPDGRDPSC